MRQAVAEPTRPALPRRAWDAAQARRAELRHAARVSVAVGAAFAVGAILHLPQAYWAVFTAVIVVQTSIGGTITASLERLLGTLVGGVVGVAGAYVRARTVVEEGLVLSAAIALLAFAAALRPGLKVAPITAAIVLVGGTASQLDPLMAAMWRVIEILIGSAIGFFATLLVFPARARGTVVERAAATMGQLGEILGLYARRLRGGSDAQAVETALQTSRKSLALVEQALGEADRELASGLGGAFVPEGLLRSLWRVRNDGTMVGRALMEPLPQPIADTIAPCAAALLDAVAAELGACASAILAGRAVTGDRLTAPRAAFELGVEQVRTARLTSGMTFEAAARVFALVFALEDLLSNLADLVDRIGEMAAAPIAVSGAGGRPGG